MIEKLQVRIDLNDAVEAASEVAEALKHAARFPHHIRSEIESLIEGDQKPFEIEQSSAGFAIKASPALCCLLANIRAGGF